MSSVIFLYYISSYKLSIFIYLPYNRVFSRCSYSPKNTFWEILGNAGALRLYILWLTSVCLYLSREACSLTGACAKKCDNTVDISRKALLSSSISSPVSLPLPPSLSVVINITEKWTDTLKSHLCQWASSITQISIFSVMPGQSCCHNLPFTEYKWHIVSWL